MYLVLSSMGVGVGGVRVELYLDRRIPPFGRREISGRGKRGRASFGGEVGVGRRKQAAVCVRRQNE